MEAVSNQNDNNVIQLSNKSDKSKSHKSRHFSKSKHRKAKKAHSAQVKHTESKWKLFFSVNQSSASCCSDDDWRFSSLVLAWGRERIFHLLGLISLLICAILFTLQAYLAFRSYQIMHQLNVKKHVPEMLYQFYFDSHDWAFNLDKVDLRANTSIFIH